MNSMSRPMLLATIALACALAARPARAADPPDPPHRLGPDWVTAIHGVDAFDAVRWGVRRGQLTSLRGILDVAARDRDALDRLTHLGPALERRLIAHLDVLDFARRAPQVETIELVRLLGPRHPEAVPLLLRMASDGNGRQLNRRAAAMAADAFHNPGDHAALLRALATAAMDRRLSRDALRYLPKGDRDVDRALADAAIRAVALGQPDDVADPLRVLDDRNVIARDLAISFQTGILTIDDQQRGRVLAALGASGLLAERSRDVADAALLGTLRAIAADPNSKAASAARWTVFERDAIKSSLARAVATALAEGRPPPSLATFKDYPWPLIAEVTPLLDSPRSEDRLAAVRLLRELDVAIVKPDGRVQLTQESRSKLRTTIAPLLWDVNEAVRNGVAEFLGDEASLRTAQTAGLLIDLRADSPTLRETAARQLEELRTLPRELTAALRRAVTNRDMPAREGLIRAIEGAAKTAQPPLAVLAAAAEADDVTPARAYARAALREIANAR